jgi:hypothetical protein
MLCAILSLLRRSKSSLYNGRYGPFFAAHRKFLGARYVPFGDHHICFLNVCLLESGS